MKKSILAVMALCLVLMNACKDPEPEPDYRDQWTGTFSCDVRGVASISDTGQSSDTGHKDTMTVSLVSDSSLLVSSLTNNSSWTFKVNESGKILSGCRNSSKSHRRSEGVFSKDEFNFLYAELGVNVCLQWEVEGRRIR